MMGSCSSSSSTPPPVTVKKTVANINKTRSFEADKPTIARLKPIARAGSGTLDEKGYAAVGETTVADLQKRVQGRLSVSGSVSGGDSPVARHVYVDVDETSLADNFSR